MASASTCCEPNAAVRPYRACELCDHVVALRGEELVCTNERVAPEVRVLPVQAARAPTGRCGPDALHLHFAGLVG